MEWRQPIFSLSDMKKSPASTSSKEQVAWTKLPSAGKMEIKSEMSGNVANVS